MANVADERLPGSDGRSTRSVLIGRAFFADYQDHAHPPR
jgi:hypothetical protein